MFGKKTPTRSWIRRSKYLLLFLVFMLTLVGGVLQAPSAGAVSPNAETDANRGGNREILNQLCVPRLTSNDQIDGWLKVRFLNRAIIKVTYEANGTCASPANADSQYISGNRRFADIFGPGLAIDTDTADAEVSYYIPSGNALRDDTHIAGFSGSMDDRAQDDTNGQDNIIDVGTLQNYVNNAFFAMGFEKSVAGIAGDICDSSGANLVFNVQDSDGDGPPRWFCSKGNKTNTGSDAYPVIGSANFSDLNNYNITYNVVGTGENIRIEHVSEKERDTRTFTWCASTSTFVSSAGNTPCTGELSINANFADFDTAAAQTNSFIPITITRRDGKSVNAYAAGSKTESATDGRKTGDDIAGRSNGDGGDSKPACKWAWNNPLTWFICPLITMAVEGIRQFDAAITRQLTVDANFFDVDGAGGDKAEALYAAWSNIRAIALALLIIAGLLMVISQAISVGPFDAYTVKKVLPRLLVAIVGITFSWDLCRLLVNISNAAGLGAKDIIYAPFSQVDGGAVFDFSSGATSIFAGIFGVTVGAVLGIMGILSFALTGLLAVVVAFSLVVLRQIAVIFLVVLAPIGIVCYILPNTEKLWKLWWESFSKLLLVFPMIMGFIAIGRAFAALSSQQASGGSGGTAIVQNAVAFIAYFGPYFAIPKLFSLAGGLFGNLTGMVNNRSKGGFDRLKKYRQGQSQQHMGQIKAGNRFEGKKWIPGSRTAAKAFDRTAVGLGTGMRGNFGLGVKGTQAIDQQRRTAMAQIANSEGGKAIADDDGALRAATFENYSAAVKGLQTEFGMTQTDAERAAKAAQTSIGFGQPQAIYAAQRLVSTGTGYTGHDILDAAGNKIGEVSALEEMTETLARAAGGNSSTGASLSGFANFEAKNRGRNDLAPSFSNLSGMVQQRIEGRTISDDTLRAAKRKAWDSGSLYTHANGKPKNLENHVKYFETELASGDAARQESAAVFFNELKAMQPNASGENGKIINKALVDHGAQLASVKATLPPTIIPPRDVQVVDAAGNLTIQRIPQQIETAADRIERQSRTYERIDPNRQP